MKRFDATSVAFLFGQEDCDNGVVPNGLAYATQVTSRGQPAAISVLSGVGHSMGAYADGGLAIEQRLTALCHP